MTPSETDATSRFWKNVEKTNRCWNWKGTITQGYGRFWLPNRRRVTQAHRLSYELLKGPIPDGLTLDHLCRNRSCVNPDHLEPVIGRVNTLRGEGPPAINSRKIHCIRGHLLPPPKPRGGKRVGEWGRLCKECHTMWDSQYPTRPRCKAKIPKGDHFITCHDPARKGTDYCGRHSI